MSTILVVDDDPDILKLLSLRLTAAGHSVKAVDSGERALAALAVSRPNVVITDLKMGGIDGLTLFEEIHKQAPTLPVIILTAHGTKGSGNLAHVPDEAVVRGHQGEPAPGALQGDEDGVAVHGQGLARQVGEQAEFGPAGGGEGRGEDPAVQELAGGVLEGVAVAHQAQCHAAGIAPGEEITEVRGGFLK